MSLEDRVKLFYETYSPAMLQNDGLRGVVAWTHNHGEEALNARLKGKYGATLADLGASTSIEAHWEKVKDALINFYAKNDPFKDAGEIDGVFVWTKKHGIAELNERLVSKYKETITIDAGTPAKAPPAAAAATASAATAAPPAAPAVASVEPKVKTPPKLPDRVSKGSNISLEGSDIETKVDVPSTGKVPEPPSILFEHSGPFVVTEKSKKAAASDGASSESQAALEKEISEKLIAFFQKHDPEKSKKDIDFLAGFAVRKGVDTVNNQLKLNFGVGLEDVGWQPHSQNDFELLSSAAKPTKPKLQEAPPPKPIPVAPKQLTPEEELKIRRDDIAAKLRIFYKKHDPARLEPANQEQFNKVVTYGVEKGLVRLNGALREKFNEDLDDVQKAVYRQSLEPFFKKNEGGLKADLQHKLAEEAMNFGLRHGQDALDEKLRMEYGEDANGNLGDL